MERPQLPAVLKGRLVFGDGDQIAAVRNYEKQHEAYYGTGDEKRFHVYVEVEYSETITVTAKSEKEAVEKARDQFDTYGLDFDVSFSAEEDKAEARPASRIGPCRATPKGSAVSRQA
jgi:hypothetical protein